MELGDEVATVEEDVELAVDVPNEAGVKVEEGDGYA